MNAPRFENRLNAWMESVAGRFVWKFVLPAALALVGYLGVRAINSLDHAIDQLQTASQDQSALVIETQGEVRAIRTQMDYQTRYQEMVDQVQNKELERHARALQLK